MSIFSNREISLAIWFILFAIWFFRDSKLRTSFGNLLHAFLNKYILFFTGATLIYIYILVYILYELKFWTTSDIKNTILWIFTSAMVTLFRCRDAQDNPYYFSTALKDNFKLIIVFEFVVTFYSFSLLVEMIAVPVLLILTLTHAYTQSSDKYKEAFKFLEWVLILYALLVIIYTAMRLLESPSGFFSMDTLHQFILPVMLSILFIPFMYFIILYMEYERVFISMERFIDRRIYPISKVLALLNFRGDWVLLSRWKKIFALKKIITIDELFSSFKLINKIKYKEKSKKAIATNEGWSPYLAAEFLKEADIKMGNYDPVYDDQWFSSSNYLSLDGDTPVLSNNISYYIDGIEDIAKQLKLVVNVNNLENSKSALIEFIKISRILFSKSLGEELPEEIENAIFGNLDRELMINDKLVTVRYRNWCGGKIDGFEAKLNISVPGYNRD